LPLKKGVETEKENLNNTRDFMGIKERGFLNGMED
jgi:hypothetical protein